MTFLLFTWRGTVKLRGVSPVNITGGMSPGSSGIEEAQGRAVALLGGQVRQQAFTLAYADAFITIAWVCAGTIVLIALMKRTKILFDSPRGGLPK